MALVCGEHGHHILVGEKIFGISDGTATTAICERALQQIPADERYEKGFPDGIDVVEGSSTSNADSTSQSFFNLRYGARLFTITRTAAKRYLPTATAELLK